MEKKMENKNLEVFSNAPVPQAVLKNVLPAMAAMIIVLIYNLADTFFIGQTRNDILIAAVSLAMPVFLIFMAVGTVFGVGGTSVISRALGEGRKGYDGATHRKPADHCRHSDLQSLRKKQAMANRHACFLFTI